MFITLLTAVSALSQSRDDVPFWQAPDEEARDANGNLTSATIKDRAHYTARVFQNGEWLTYHYKPHTDQVVRIQAKETTDEYSYDDRGELAQS